ncbi:hypothetical protein [Natronorubrum sulfidifaciens]|uniref:Uncharacterized protein n=1 Tax=Natronorubrum sulfidifaciens JCM 14089 TaxID=1230460 RepID=L9W9U9_9EURY|nr:hypothetical protein [Natronorubrum sulfidifaciens]ELY45083.1 hypothetical protein C495_09080 [Natronorubrum sulfidifaciens JCM 14089]
MTVAGCATRLGLADRVEVVQKYVRAHPRETADPIDVAVRRYDPDTGPYYHDDLHESLAGELGPDDPLEITDALAARLQAEFEIVEYRIRGCDVDDGDCRHTTLVREDFNALEAGDIADLVYRSSGAGLVSVSDSP